MIYVFNCFLGLLVGLFASDVIYSRLLGGNVSLGLGFCGRKVMESGLVCFGFK